jgi:5'-3' exonuclease
MKIVLIDADTLCYIGKEGDDEGEVLDKVDQALSNIITQSQATHYSVFIEPMKNNIFRKKIFSTYKAGRKKRPLPPFYTTIKSYITEDWNGYGINGYETDDVLISAWRKLSKEYPFSDIILAVMDKDYKQYPITMFDTYYRRFGEVTTITDVEAQYNLFSQMITGDTTDDIKGVKGKGKVASESALISSKNRFISTCRVYKSVYGGRWQKEFIKNYTQVKLLDNLNCEFQLHDVNND